MLLLIVVACQGRQALRVDDPPSVVAPEAPPDTAPRATADSTGDTGAGACALDAPDPGPPVRTPHVGVVTATVRTGEGASDGTTDRTVELCLGARCFPLAQGSQVQLAAGAVGVWMFEGVDLPRAELEGLALAVSDGGDGWAPVALDVRFDGEPVYCDALALELGTGPGEVARWTDPLGLHQSCVSAWDDRLLTHGPAVMAVGPDRAKVWVRTDATRAVEVRIRPTDAPDAERVAGWVYPLAAEDFTGVVPIECLEPRTAYTYEVWVDGVPQGEHTFTTAPADGLPGSFRMAFGSCTAEEVQPIFTALAAHAPDLFAFVGDNHYANTDDLDSLRYWYRWSVARPERAAFLARTPTLATWDDHDFVGDDSDGSAPGKDRALRAFVEYQSNPSAGTAATPGVFFASRWGDVDLFFLDNRYWRGVDGNALGDAQHAWLVDELTAATGTFKVLVVGSQWTLEGDADSWSQHGAERDDLFQLIADQRIPGVVLLSGDIHRGELRTLEAPGYPLPEITSSPLASTNLPGCPGASPELHACVAQQNLWVTVSFDTTLADPTVTATFHGADGAELGGHVWTLSQLTAPGP